MKKDLYEVVTQHGHELSKNQIQEIAKEAIYQLYSRLDEKEYREVIEEIYEETDLILD